MHLYKTNRFLNNRALIISLLVFAIVIVGVVVLLNGTEQKSGDEQAVLLKDALRSAAVSCYAVEGRYPPTLEYLTKNYGTVINEDRFIVKYNVFADNVMPDISVLEHGKEQSEDDAIEA